VDVAAINNFSDSRGAFLDAKTQRVHNHSVHWCQGSSLLAAHFFFLEELRLRPLLRQFDDHPNMTWIRASIFTPRGTKWLPHRPEASTWPMWENVARNSPIFGTSRRAHQVAFLPRSLSGPLWEFGYSRTNGWLRGNMPRLRRLLKTLLPNHPIVKPPAATHTSPTGQALDGGAPLRRWSRRRSLHIGCLTHRITPMNESSALSRQIPKAARTTTRIDPSSPPVAGAARPRVPALCTTMYTPRWLSRGSVRVAGVHLPVVSRRPSLGLCGFATRPAACPLWQMTAALVSSNPPLLGRQRAGSCG